MGKKKLLGVELIAKERQRQIVSEGWTTEHDSLHTGGQLADAAACYAAAEPIFVERRYTINGDKRFPVVHFENLWPFDRCWYKPKDRIRDLVRAGALIAAEIDRLQERVR